MFYFFAHYADTKCLCADVPSSHMGQQIFNPPAATMPTATAAAAQQAIIQPAAYIATPVLNYPAGPHAAAVQLTTAAPSATHYQIAAAPTGHVPIAQATPVVMAAAPQVSYNHFNIVVYKFVCFCFQSRKMYL